MKKNNNDGDNVLALNCTKALELIKKIKEGHIIYPLDSSALDAHIKGCQECAKELIEVTKKQRE